MREIFLFTGVLYKLIKCYAPYYIIVTIVQLSEEESREIELKYPLIILFAPAKDLSSSPISDKSAITLGGDN